MNSFTPFSVMKSVISCMCLVASSLCSIVYMASGGCFADAVRSDRDHLEAWMETTPQQAADIWLRPMLSGTEGPTTVQRPVHICEQQQVARLAKILHSRQSRTAFLGPFGHWGAIRYARLQAHATLLAISSMSAQAMNLQRKLTVLCYQIVSNGCLRTKGNGRHR